MSSDEAVALSVPAGPGQAEAEAEFKWTAGNAALSVFLFVASGLLEVGGGWLVWQAVREKRPWYFGLGGVAALAVYGFVPCAQPMPDFGRIYAIYGGFFILLSFLWGWLLDGIKVSREERAPGAASAAGRSLTRWGDGVPTRWTSGTGSGAPSRWRACWSSCSIHDDERAKGNGGEGPGAVRRTYIHSSSYSSPPRPAGAKSTATACSAAPRRAPGRAA